MPRPGSRWLVAWLLALVASALLGGCGWVTTNSLRSGGPGEPTPWGLGVTLPAGQAERSVGAINLCLEEPGSATVTGVDFEQASGVRVTAWSVRDGSRIGLGSSEKDLGAEGFPKVPSTVEVVCDDVDDSDAYPSELGMRLELVGDHGKASVVRVRYTLGGRSGVLSEPFTIEMTQPEPAGRRLAAPAG